MHPNVSCCQEPKAGGEGVNLLSDAVRNLEAFHGDVLRQLLQAVNEPDLPAELFTAKNTQSKEE